MNGQKSGAEFIKAKPKYQLFSINEKRFRVKRLDKPYFYATNRSYSCRPLAQIVESFAGAANYYQQGGIGTQLYGEPKRLRNSRRQLSNDVKKNRKPDAYHTNIKETDFIQCKSFRENVKNNTQRTWLWDNP
jgi:hypothetical protein